ncbi:hypothetical protein [Methylobacterium nodulans]|nr:hypothetical protein [Methylobacterium nodulans]
MVDGLAHTYAAATAAGDLSVAVRALRELRGLLQFHVLVPVEKLKQAPGWVEPPIPRDPMAAMALLLMSPDGSAPAEEALEELEACWPGFTADWREGRKDPPNSF